MSYSPIVERVSDVVRSYAGKCAKECGYTPPFKPLSLICGEEEALTLCTHRMNGEVPTEFMGCSLFDDDERVYALFGLMNPKEGHREGAISFRSEDGRVAGMGVYIKDPPSVDIDMEPTYEVVRKVTGELGARHMSAALGSLNEGIDIVAVVGKRRGAFMPFIKGKIIEEYLWAPNPEGLLLVPEHAARTE